MKDHTDGAGEVGIYRQERARKTMGKKGSCVGGAPFFVKSEDVLKM